MAKYKNGYLTRVALTTEIKRVIAKTHKLKYSDIIVNWLSSWKITKYPTGLIMKLGKIRLRAIGYKTQDYFVYQTKNNKWHMI